MLDTAGHRIEELNARERDGGEQTTARAGANPRGPLRTLAAGELLFQDGDTRARIYRVESGAVCHYILWDDGRHEVIEFAFPGDIIGFGHLDTHISTAQAVTGTAVSFVGAQEFQASLDSDGQLAARLSAAADREFDVLRQRTLASALRTPEARVAAFLLAVSHANAAEGRDASIITDSMSCGAAAGLLNMDLETLSDALVSLEKRGLVAKAGRGLRLTGVAGLEALTA